MQKAILIGALTGAGSILEYLLVLYFGFPYPGWVFFFLYISLAPVSIAIFKFLFKSKLSMDAALQVGIAAYVTMIVLSLVVAAVNGEVTMGTVVLISFFSFLFGFALTAVSANFFVADKKLL